MTPVCRSPAPVSVTLNGIGFNVAAIDLGAQTVSQGTSHSIHGKGTVIGYNGGTLINDGTIVGDDPAGSLQVDLSNLSNHNNGTLKAGNGGLLGMYGGTIDQTGGGTFLADGIGSLVQFAQRDNGLNVPTVIGGTLKTSNDALIEAVQVRLQDVTNTGAVQIPPGSLMIVTGTNLTDNGTILVNTTGVNSAASLRFDTNVSLAGTGSVTLNGIGFNVANIDLGLQTVTHGASHTIHGKGTIIGYNGGTLINDGTIVGDDPAGSLQVDLSNLGNQNNGTIKATGGALLGVYGGTINQTATGILLADGAGSLLQFAATNNGTDVPTIIGGTLDTSNGGLIEADRVTLQNVSNNGDIQIPPGNLMVVNDSLQNDGSILVNTTAVNNTATLRFDSDTQLTGSGEISLNGAGFNSAGFSVNNVAVTNGAGHTIGGTGDLFIDGAIAVLTNNGIIAPGNSAGILNFRGLLTLGSASNLSFEIGGTSQGTQYDLLNKTDDAILTLNGNLAVTLINDFTPMSSDLFTVVTTQAVLASSFYNAPNGGRLNTCRRHRFIPCHLQRAERSRRLPQRPSFGLRAADCPAPEHFHPPARSYGR